MANELIEMRQLTKTFKSQLAVDHVDLTIRKGDIFGLIGPNGAGKSTLLKMLAGFIHPTAGDIILFNHNAQANPGYYERMGILIEQVGVFPQYTGYKNLDLIALAYGFKNRKAEITNLLNMVDLSSASKTKVKDYSMGMKQRLGIAMALLGSPDVLILDEPTNGLDPQGIASIRQLILELNKAGLTIIISSHILEELSKVATQYAIINQGKIIETMSKDELLLKCEDRIEVEVDQAKVAVPILEEWLGIKRYKVISERVIHIYEQQIKSQQIVKALADENLFVHAIKNQSQSLEHYFLERIERIGEQDD
ncbi:ABC-2 type transport system ATP-binding protein [Amphibacillus marinus]|uniref:ABC-2 type transport system ATP-binding protein n=1 Tax=Amphibacillus marinus TaxID=872970 RepID=A0A1H8T7W0_9BACI|nr:ATP-binding cassette domain-containing protein [Amphibacillus marinus]SEO86991.1 ABC-2 type transport system ATP-binding protein [Amphibacillus marinus]